MLAVVPVSNNTHSYFWEKVQKCWKIHKGPSIHLFFLLFFPSLNLQVCGAGRGPGSSEASVCTFSLSLSHFLFVVFSFSLSLSLLPRRKRNSSFSLIEPVVLNDGRPLFRHTHRWNGAPFPRAHWANAPLGKKKTFTGERLLHAREPLRAPLFFFSSSFIFGPLEM